MCYMYRRVDETAVKKEDEDSGGPRKATGETPELQASGTDKGL